MNCPDCDSARTQVAKSLSLGQHVTRKRQCDDCGLLWITEERIVHVHRRPGVTAGGQGRPPVATGGSPPPPPPLSPPLNPPLMPPLSPPLVRTSPAKKPVVYSPEFLSFWARYPKRTGKGNAWKAWKTQHPDLETTLKALDWQAKDPEWSDPKYIPHPASYLNARRWEDEPASINRTRAPPPTSAYCDFHQEPRNAAKRSFRPSDTCPECKHVRALERRTETSEPTLLGEI